MPRAKPYYSYVTRTLLDLFDEGRLPLVESIEVEPEYGYAARVRYRDGSIRMIRGNDVGLNPSGSCDVAKDKGHSKFFLERSEITCPRGSAFLLPWWAAKLRSSRRAAGGGRMRLTEDAPAYVAEQLGYPVYVKPVDGSQGSNISRCERPDALVDALAKLECERVRVAIVEEAVELPDYRLVVLDDSIISAYRRRPLAVLGDGRSTVSALLEKLLAEFSAQGRTAHVSIEDPRVEQCLDRQGRNRDFVPKAGERVQLLDVSNLSLGGVAEEVTDSVAQRWRDLAVEVTRRLGLRYCGVDLACADIADPESRYAVLEVNAAPGLDHYAEVGSAQTEWVKDLYAQVLNALPTPP